MNSQMANKTTINNKQKSKKQKKNEQKKNDWKIKMDFGRGASVRI